MSFFARTGPLSPRERDELGDRLLEATDDKLADLPTLDGFFTAEVIGPERIGATECFETIFGARWGKLSERRDAKRLLRLLQRHHDAIAKGFSHDPVEFSPILEAHEMGGESAVIMGDWCSGFMRAIALRERAWAPLAEGMKRDARSPLHAIWTQGTREGWERAKLHLTRDSGKDIEMHRQWWLRVEESVFAIYAYWLRQGLKALVSK